MDDRTRRIGTEGKAEPFPGSADEAFRGDDALSRGETAPRRSRLTTIAGLVLAVLAAYGLYRYATTAPAPSEATKSQRPVPPQPVGAATIGTGDIRITVGALGTVTPIATVTVKSRVSGHLLEVAFKEGQIVEKNQFLAQIDPRPFELAEQQQEGQLLRDQGLLDQARMNLERYQMLVKQNSIARQQAEDQVFVVKQYEGLVKTDVALLDAQKLNLTYARVLAPISGRIGLRLVDAGNYVQTTDTGLAVITQLHPISVIFNVPEDELPKIMAEVGAGRTLEVTAYDRANVAPLATGKVATVDNQIDQTTGTVKIRAEFENLDDRLFPNQFVNARLLIRTLREVVTVPSSAIQRGAPGTYVYVVNADDTVSVRGIELGPADGAMFAVTSGLSVGDRVVMDGTDRLREGARVTLPSEAGRAREPRGAETTSPPGREPRQRGGERQKGGP